MSNYYIYNGQLFSADELKHYGVLGMKWGVIRASSKKAQNTKLKKKALEYDLKSDKAAKAAEKVHAKKDLGRANRAANKANRLNIKADKLEKRANKADNDLVKATLHARADTARYKASKARIKGNRLSKSAGYGSKAMRLSVKSDTFAKKAAKARMKLARNERYIAAMSKKLSEIDS